MQAVCALAMATHVGCSGGQTKTPAGTCRPGTVDACHCTNGGVGKHTCSEAGKWGSCGSCDFSCTPGTSCECRNGRQSVCDARGRCESCGTDFVGLCTPGLTEVCECDDGVYQGSRVCRENGTWEESCNGCDPAPDETCKIGQQRRCQCTGTASETASGLQSCQPPLSGKCWGLQKDCTQGCPPGSICRKLCEPDGTPGFCEPAEDYQYCEPESGCGVWEDCEACSVETSCEGREDAAMCGRGKVCVGGSCCDGCWRRKPDDTLECIDRKDLMRDDACGMAGECIDCTRIPISSQCNTDRGVCAPP